MFVVESTNSSELFSLEHKIINNTLSDEPSSSVEPSVEAENASTFVATGK